MYCNDFALLTKIKYSINFTHDRYLFHRILYT